MGDEGGIIVMRHVNRSFGLFMALGASALVVTGCPGPAPAPTSIAVTTTADVVDANDGVVSLREAVTKAAQDGADSTISLDGAAEYALTRCDLGAPIHSADQTVSITTDDGSRATIRQTCSQGQVLRFTGGAVELSHLVVRGGRLGSRHELLVADQPGVQTRRRHRDDGEDHAHRHRDDRQPRRPRPRWNPRRRARSDGGCDHS
ncbi:MAG: CSLREA domain-containing protein [Microthrixaceae bacterium]